MNPIGTSAAPRSSKSSLLFVASALAIVYLVWGSTYLAIRVMVDDVPPLLGAGTRFLVAGLLIAVAIGSRRGFRALAVTRRQLCGCAALGLLMLVLCQGMVTFAEAGGAESGTAALLIAAVPLWVVCCRLASGERPRILSLTGVMLGFGGVAIVVVATSAGGTSPLWTVLMLIGAGFFWALGSWTQRRLSLPSSPFVITVYVMLISGVALVVIGLLSAERFSPSTWSP